MELIRYCNGERHTIHLMDCGSKHDVRYVLDQLEANGNRDYYQMIDLLDRTAKHGVIWNDLKTKKLTSTINEFKARGGTRFLWFFDQTNRSIIICTNAFVKKQQKTPREEIKRAEERRMLYCQDCQP
jgi:phage-related protein